MKYYANKTDINLANSLAVDMATAGVVSSTPKVLRRRLGDLSRLTFLQGKLYSAVNSGGTGAATLRLMAGGATLHSATLDFTASADHYLGVDVDLASVSAASDIYIEVECDTIGGNATVNAWVEASAPLVIG